MEKQEELQTKIGTEEATTLKPEKVTILNVEVQEVGEKKSKKVVCLCSHPENKEGIHISSVKYEKKGKLEVVGLWFNKDKEDLIQKGSALALFIQNNNAEDIEGLVDKEVETVLDDNGYLTFKNY